MSREEFAALANYRSDSCISIYIPTHRSGVEVNEKHDPIVFKNNLQQARVLLTTKGLDKASIEKILKPATDLLKDDVFWKNQLQGLAAFLSTDLSKIVKLPTPVKEELFINSSFLLTPLLPAIYKKHRFYLLVLSKHDARLYEGDQFEMRKLEVNGLPHGMAEVLHFKEKDHKEAHKRANIDGQRAIEGASFHGGGIALADEDEWLIQYFREIDQVLKSEVLHNQHIPLVLAAVDYEIGLYKQISSYRHIADAALVGNFEQEDKNNLYQKVREKLTPYFKEYTNKALKNYYENSATALTTSIPAEVIPACYYAQVSDLFVEKDARIWGTFNKQDNQIEIHEQQQEGDVCLVNDAIIETLANGGEVHIMEKEKMPSDSTLAAFLRFSL